MRRRLAQDAPAFPLLEQGRRRGGDALGSGSCQPLPVQRFPVAWIGGRWYIGESVPDTYIEDGAWLDHWLAQRQCTRDCLNFNGSRAMEQRFISDLGPVTSRP